MAERIGYEKTYAYWSGILLASELAEKGKRAFFDVVNQRIVKGKAQGGCVDLGVFAETKTGVGSTTRIEVKLHDQVTARRWVNDSAVGGTIASTDLFKIVYQKDDETVSMIGGGRVPAGYVLEVTSAGVMVAPLAMRWSARRLLPAAALAFVANDAVVPLAEHDTLFDVGTTAAASTVTLPAAGIEGQRLYFIADGVKNGHTVTYRDATGPVSLTAALTASKRHLAVAVFLNGKWAVTVTVAP